MMNDEQFQEDTEALRRGGYVCFVDDLRARDTAQREALARLEAERDDIAKSRDQAITDWNQAVDQRDTAQAQLAEAVGLLRGLDEQWNAHDGEKLFGKLIVSVETFLAGHAQAEQQEAQGAQAGEFQREDRYIVIKRKDFYRLPMELRLQFSMALRELAPRLPKREYLIVESDWPEYEPAWAAIQARMTGQGAQAVDERAAFEGWFTEKAKTLPLLRGESVLRYHDGQGQYVSDWALFGHMVWKARTALATQPAMRECSCPKIGERFSAEKHAGPCPVHDAVRGAEHDQ